MDQIDRLDVLAYVTLFAPFAATVLITLLTLRSKALSAAIAVLGIGVGLVCNVLMAIDVFGPAQAVAEGHELIWLSSEWLDLRFGVLTDSLSVLMSLVVTGVGLCIFVFSTGYMRGEEGYSRYFACLSLFAFSMLGIVFSTNLVQTFIFWELVGVSSYALIGYYFGKDSAVEAGKKAFLTNRIGDFGMTVGILLLLFTLVEAPGVAATLSFHELVPIFNDRVDGALPDALAGFADPLMWSVLLIFTGAMAKSAQVPLHVWLPDAMEGPTPVSALMHAATMVAAGVYLTARTFFMFAPFQDALFVVAIIGGVTALLAALMAFVQYDVKKVLAYSTLSQLGYMVLSLGLFGPAAAMFHLMTHAFFKALLFLGAGSVIHGCHHEQDMRHMGGLRKLMPVTHATFLVGSLALAGIFPLAGFWSKDAILATALHHFVPLYVIGLGVAVMTAAYMGRAYFLTFAGQYRGHAHPHESPPSMTGPLVVLAVLSVVGGFLSIPADMPGGFPWLVPSGLLEHELIGPGQPIHYPGVEEELFAPGVALLGTLAALAGAFVAWMYYGSRRWSADAFVARFGGLHRLLVRKFYFDEFYGWLVQGVQQRVAEGCAYFEKNVLVRGVIDGLAAFNRWLGYQIRLLLDGHLHRYVTLALAGVVFIVAVVWLGNG